jgi:hypothetical protein
MGEKVTTPSGATARRPDAGPEPVEAETIQLSASAGREVVGMVNRDE